MLLAILALLEEPHELKPIKWLFLGLTIASTGTALLLLPLVAWNYWKTRCWRYLSLVGLILAFLWLNSQATAAMREVAPTAFSLGKFDYRILRIVAENFLFRLLYLNFLGPDLTSKILKTAGWLFWPTSVFLFLVLVRAVRQRTPIQREALFALLLVFVSMSSSFGLAAMGRPYLFNLVQRTSGETFWHIHYSFYTTSLATLFWVALFAGASGFKYRRAVSAFGLLLLMRSGVFENPSVNPRPDLNWSRTAEKIQAAVNLKRAGNLKSPVSFRNVRLHPDLGTDVTIRP